MTAGPTGPGVLDAHLTLLAEALLPFRSAEDRLARWGAELAGVLAGGGRILVAGNGGSAAEAQHLTAELVGKLRDDRAPLAAIALHAETSAVTAIANDYGYDEVFARQVRAHGRPGDVLLLISTSGASANLLAAARAGRTAGLRCWAFTGPAPNPLAGACHEVLAIASPEPQVVQELHLVATHVLCEHVDRTLPVALAAGVNTAAAVDVAAPVDTAAPVDVAAPVGAPGPADAVPPEEAGPVRAGVEVIVDDAGRRVGAGRGGVE
ncbi:SIS domain-containing protein [Micromonospora sp. CPCC 205711]|uniref:D-sedoheptulose-7-phosphate isomerase n=1 Tax=Micromonospora sp. CPCC 205547 TaxID=3122400 RepID=UPI002FF3C56E